MTNRKSNIELDLTDKDKPVKRQDENTDETDADIPEYVTAPEPEGEMETENVPESPVAATIAQFNQQTDYPDLFTNRELEAIAVSRLKPDLSTLDVANRLDLSDTFVKQAKRRAELSILTDPEEIHAAFRDRSDRQQRIIAVSVEHPDCSTKELGELADCPSQSARSTSRLYTPLIRKLREVGLPDAYEHSEEAAENTDKEMAVCEECGASFETPQQLHGHKASHSKQDDANETKNESESDNETGQSTITESIDDETIEDGRAPRDSETVHSTAETGRLPQTELQQIQQFVSGLRDAAATEHELADDRGSHQSTAARQAVCETILKQIETVCQSGEPEKSEPR